MERAADILNVTVKKLEFVVDSLGANPNAEGGEEGLVAILGGIEADLREALEVL